MASVLRDPYHLEIVEEAPWRHVGSREVFDRVAFARDVLRVLMPPRWTVALYQRNSDFYVDRVRDLRRGLDGVSAIVGVPATASRAEIAVTIAELTGKRDAPFLVDLLASNAGASAHASG